MLLTPQPSPLHIHTHHKFKSKSLLQRSHINIFLSKLRIATTTEQTFGFANILSQSYIPTKSTLCPQHITFSPHPFIDLSPHQPTPLQLPSSPSPSKKPHCLIANSRLPPPPHDHNRWLTEDHQYTITFSTTLNMIASSMPISGYTPIPLIYMIASSISVSVYIPIPPIHTTYP